MMRSFLFVVFAWVFALPLEATERPNIVWIMVEDMSPHFGCYGEKSIATPVVNKMAAEGTRFTRAFVTAPICSISRSALITGRYQTSIGAQNHRSSTMKYPIALPADAPTVPRLFRDAGYHVNNLTLEAFLRSDAEAKANPGVKVAKTDYNFVWEPEALFDGTHWAARSAEKPFFVQVQLQGGKYRGQGTAQNWPMRVQRDLGSVTLASELRLPGDLPEDAVIREDWAQYLDTVRYTDWEVGRVLQRLKDAGSLENTVVFFFTDHGVSHVRHKQFCYDGGLHVPLVVRGPGIPKGATREDLAEHIDIAATSLQLAGIPRPAAMEARPLFGSEAKPREYVFAARDRADETVDRIRAARSERYKYIRNFYPNRPYLQPNLYKDGKPIVQTMRRLHAEGKLTPEQALIMAETRPSEEFYDVQADPLELHNLADDPAHRAALEKHREALQGWIERTKDHGATPEAEEVYRDNANPDRPEGGGRRKNDAVIESNIELMVRWATERPMQK